MAAQPSRIDLSKPPRWAEKHQGRPKRGSSSSGAGFWDGFFTFALLDGLGDLLGGLLEGLGSD